MNRSHNSPFITHHDAFKDVLGDAPRLIKVIDTDAHEGPVYVPDEDDLYFTTLPTPPRLRRRGAGRTWSSRSWTMAAT